MSQLAFCVAEMVDETRFKAHRETLVFSRVMSDGYHERIGLFEKNLTFPLCS
jgi:hypothetical protein